MTLAMQDLRSARSAGSTGSGQICAEQELTDIAGVASKSGEPRIQLSRMGAFAPGDNGTLILLRAHPLEMPRSCPRRIRRCRRRLWAQYRGSSSIASWPPRRGLRGQPNRESSDRCSPHVGQRRVSSRHGGALVSISPRSLHPSAPSPGKEKCGATPQTIQWVPPDFRLSPRHCRECERGYCGPSKCRQRCVPRGLVDGGAAGEDIVR